MQTVNLEEWQLVYNESHNEIRLFVNCFSKDAVIVPLNSGNIVRVLEALDKPETHRITLLGQPVVAQSYDWIIEEGIPEEEREERINYHVEDDDLSKFFKGDKRAVTIAFLESRDRAELSRMLWDFWAVDHLLLEAEGY